MSKQVQTIRNVGSITTNYIPLKEITTGSLTTLKYGTN